MNQNKKAFTLIELLVVVLIIGILSAIVLPQYQKAVAKSRYTQLMVLVRAAANAQEVYYLANNAYATKFEDLDIQMPTNETTNSNDHLFVPAGKVSLWISSTSVGGSRVSGEDSKQPRFACRYNHVDIEAKGKCFCYGWSDEAIAICKALGGQLQGSYNSNKLDENLYLF